MELVVQDFGVFVGLKSERAQVRKGKAVVQEAPLLDLERVVLVGAGISISTDVVQACAARGSITTSRSSKSPGTASRTSRRGTRISTTGRSTKAPSAGCGCHSST